MGVLRRFLGVLLLGVVGLLIVGFATGRVASVVTNGVSMLPTHRAGDLVLVVRHDRYEIGDVVAYRDEASGEVVLHRIVDVTADGFTIKGDNNRSTDSATPTADELIGAEALRLPRVGRWLGSPLVLALVAGLLVALGGLTALGPRGAPDDRTPDRGASDGRASDGRSTPDRSPIGRGPDGRRRPRARRRRGHLALLAVTVAVAGGLVAAFVAPPTEVPAPPVPMHVGSLGYTASVAPGDTYPDGLVQTGQPVFSKLADQVAVTFRYEGDPTLVANARLRAILGAAAGWSTSLTLAPLTPVVAGGVQLHGTLDLTAMRDLLARVQDATGLTLTTVQLQLEAVVTPDPSTDASTFTEQIVFRLDEIGLHPAESTEVTPSLDGPVVASTQPVRDEQPAPREVGGVPRAARRWLVVALLVLIAATVTAWPSHASATAADDGDGDAEVGDHRENSDDGERDDPTPMPAPADVGAGAPVPRPTVRTTRVAAVELPPVPMRVRLASRADLDRIALDAEVPVLERDDGWAAVVTPTCLHWWEPDGIPPAPPRWAPALPIELGPLPPPPHAPAPRRTTPVLADPFDASPESPYDAPPTTGTQAPVLLVADPLPPLPPLPPPAPHELPTTEIRLDAVEQLRDEFLTPRRPLFRDRRVAAHAVRATIDDIVAYLSDAPGASGASDTPGAPATAGADHPPATRISGRGTPASAPD